MNKRSAFMLVVALLVCAPLAIWLARTVRRSCELQMAAREVEHEVLTTLIRDADKSIREYKTLKWHWEKLSNSPDDDVRSRAHQSLSKIRQATKDTERSRLKSAELLEEVERELAQLRHAGVNTILLIASISFGAACVWLTVRVVNRRERWAKRTSDALSGLTAERIG
jgi:hypothetical protein